MASIFDQFQSPAPVDVAGTPFQDQPSAVSKLLFGQPSGPDVRDPQKMAPARYIVSGGKTLDPSQDAAWDEATASPRAKKVREIMGSEPMRRLMDLANFIGPGPKMPMRAMAPEGPKGIKAYHGSPHDFDRFDLSKIGTGEGAQAYGHGLYFAEKESVAKGYRDALQAFKYHANDAPVPDELQVAAYRLKVNNGDPETALKTWLNDTYGETPGSPSIAREEQAMRKQLAELSGRDISLKPTGHMYEVNIKADPADFLDWDVPLSQQSEKVRSVLSDRAGRAYSDDEFKSQFGNVLAGTPYEGMTGRHILEPILAGGGKSAEFVGLVRQANPEAAARLERAIADYGSPTGAHVYKNMGHSSRSTTDIVPSFDRGVEASQALREAGIPGIKYKDQGSRGAEGGTSNFVVFDENLIDIIKKYGLAGLLAGGGALTQGNGGNGDAF
jgi:hypothetical protein